MLDAICPRSPCPFPRFIAVNTLGFKGGLGSPKAFLGRRRVTVIMPSCSHRACCSCPAGDFLISSVPIRSCLFLCLFPGSFIQHTLIDGNSLASMVRTLHFHCPRARVQSAGWGTKIPQAVWRGQNQNKTRFLFFFLNLFILFLAELGLRCCALEHRLSSCGTWAQLLCGMWDLPGPGLEPMSPALASRFFNHCATREVPKTR